MLNNPFVRALGLVALCYLLLQALGWGLHSAALVADSFSDWVKYTLVPHGLQIGLAVGVAYLLLTAVTSSRD